MSTRIASLLAALCLASAAAACAVEDTTDTTDLGTSEEHLWGDLSTRPSFELWKDEAGQFRFQLLAPSQEVVLSSQGYSNRTNALTGLLSVLQNGTFDFSYKVVTVASGSYVELRAHNHATIATGPTFATAAEAQASIPDTIKTVGAYQKAWDTATGARFAIKLDAGGKHYFTLHARNGEIVLRSQRYDAKAGALNGAFSVADNGTTAARYQVLQASNGGYYLNLTATNGQIIATSEVYASKYNAERARDSIIALLPVVPLL